MTFDGWKKEALRYLVWVRLMNRGHFVGAVLPTHPHAIHAAAPEGLPAGGSATDLYADKNLHSVFPLKTAWEKKIPLQKISTLVEIRK